MATRVIINLIEPTAEKPLNYHKTVFESLPSFNSYHKYELPEQNLLPPKWESMDELLEQIAQLLFALRYRVEDYVNLPQEALRFMDTHERIWAFFHEVILPLPHTIRPADIEDARIDLLEKMHEAHLKYVLLLRHSFSSKHAPLSRNKDVSVYELMNPGAEAQEPTAIVNDDGEIMMHIPTFARANGNEFQSDRDFTLRQNRISDSDLTEYTFEFIPDEMPEAPGLDDQAVEDGAPEENEDAPEPTKAAPKKKAAAKKGKGKGKVVDNEAMDSDHHKDAPEPPKAAPKKKAPAKKAPAKKAKGKAKAGDGEATEAPPAPAKKSTAGKKKASAPAEVLPTTRVTRASSRLAGTSAPELLAPPPAPRPTRRGRPPVAADVPPQAGPSTVPQTARSILPQAGPSNVPPAIARKSHRSTRQDPDPVDAPDSRRLGKKRSRPADNETNEDDSPVPRKQARLKEAFGGPRVYPSPPQPRPGMWTPMGPPTDPYAPAKPGTRVRVVHGVRYTRTLSPERADNL
ncbi:hypothetical protein C8R47DRAFT_404932 [Mycena vitilis]|nr:hypothetical protein C8R47DRAFT_404932 [Mycena vitilis]